MNQIRTYQAWQMKQERFRDLHWIAYQINPESKPEPVNLDDFYQTYQVELAGGIMNNLERLYMLLNQDDRPTGKIAHSLSIGDIIQVEDVFYQVIRFGFKEIKIQ